MKLIATYARVSTSHQKDQKTIKNQIDELRIHAAEKGYKIVREYADDGWSGTLLARPGLDQLRNDAKNKIFEAVLVSDPDRISRKSGYQLLVMEELMEAEIELIFLKISSPKDDDERIMFGFRGLFADYEKNKIRERFRLGKNRKVREGHILTSQASYGHRYIPNVMQAGKVVEHGHYIIEPEEAKNLNNIFNWIDQEGLTLRHVVTRLHELGIKPRKSKRGVWTTGTLSTLIRNKALIGEAHWGKSEACIAKNPQNKGEYKKSKKTSRRDKPEEEWVANKIPVPPIIDRELFTRVQARLKANLALLQRNKKNEYLLAGKIYCICGRRRAGEGPMHGKHLYYRCNDRVYSYPLPKTCMEKGINARIADKLVWQKFVEFVSSPEAMREQIDYWITRRQNRVNPLLENTGAFKNEYSKLKKQENLLINALTNEAITEDQLKEYIAPIKKRISELETLIREAEQKENSVHTIRIPGQNELREVATKAKETLQNLNFEQKRAIIMSVIEKIVGTQQQLQITGYVPFNVNFDYYVKFKTECGNRGSAQCGQIHII